jgi:hypothetical protein
MENIIEILQSMTHENVTPEQFKLIKKTIESSNYTHFKLTKNEMLLLLDLIYNNKKD